MSEFAVSMIKCDMPDCKSTRPYGDDGAVGWMNLYICDGSSDFAVCPECTKKPISSLVGDYPLPGFMYEAEAKEKT